MGFFHRKTNKKTSKLKSLLKLTVARLAVVRRPRLCHRSIACGDVGQLLALGQLDRAVRRAGRVIEEDNILEVFDIIELYCKRLIEQCEQLDKPKERGEEVKEAAAGLVFAATRRGDLPELLDARAVLADKLGRDFAQAAKEGTGVVDPTLVWRLSCEPTTMELKRKVAKEIAAENNMQLDFPEHSTEFDDDDRPCQDDMHDESPDHVRRSFRRAVSATERSIVHVAPNEEVGEFGADTGPPQDSLSNGVTGPDRSGDDTPVPKRRPASVRTRR